MKEKYNYMFTRYIYKKLGLKQIEDIFISKGIKEHHLYDKGISKYFYVVNDVNETKLNGVLKEKYNYYFSRSIDDLCDPKLEEELSSFFEETYRLLLFPNVNEPYVYYGPINDKYMALSDSIVLGFYYNEFDLEDENFEEKRFQNDVLICDNLNYIQYTLAPKANMKVSVIKYNEFFNKKNYKF